MTARQPQTFPTLEERAARPAFTQRWYRATATKDTANYKAGQYLAIHQIPTDAPEDTQRYMIYNIETGVLCTYTDKYAQQTVQVTRGEDNKPVRLDDGNALSHIADIQGFAPPPSPHISRRQGGQIRFLETNRVRHDGLNYRHRVSCSTCGTQQVLPNTEEAIAAITRHSEHSTWHTLIKPSATGTERS
jgi:hypothetical protein